MLARGARIKARISATFTGFLADRLAVMRRQDDIRAAQALAKRSRATPPKPLVADLGNLVDQINVEVDRQAGSKGEARAHPGRIGVDRHVEIFVELGKFLDKAERRPETRAIDPGDERDILATAQIAVERAAEAERERHPGAAADRSAIGHLRAGEQPNEGRLAGAVGAEDPEIMTRRELECCILQHGLATAGGGISLCDPVERDQIGTLSLRRSARSSPIPPTSDKMARMTR
jgi:hypothetical protein